MIIFYFCYFCVHLCLEKLQVLWNIPQYRSLASSQILCAFRSGIFRKSMTWTCFHMLYSHKLCQLSWKDMIHNREDRTYSWLQRRTFECSHSLWIVGYFLRILYLSFDQFGQLKLSNIISTLVKVLSRLLLWTNVILICFLQFKNLQVWMLNIVAILRVP